MKKCGRCKQNFECKSSDIEQCDCRSVVLSSFTQAFLSETFYDCLCNTCLNELEQVCQQIQNETIPFQRNQLQENIHYYIENGLFVFTERYHILKGKCCRNGCRHCAYGFTK